MRRLFKVVTLFVSTVIVIAADAEILLLGEHKNRFIRRHINSSYVNSLLP